MSLWETLSMNLKKIFRVVLLTSGFCDRCGRKTKMKSERNITLKNGLEFRQVRK